MSEHRSDLYSPPEAVANAACTYRGMAAYETLVAEADADHSAYWARLAREFVSWKTPFTKVLDDSEAPFFKWFEDGTLNASYNCLDRQVEAGLGDKVAIIFEADDGQVARVTYRELLARTCRLANALKARGVKKGDRVVIYMSMSVEGRGRDAGLRAHRRDPFGGVRRLLGAEPARPHRRHRRGDGHHRRRADARRQGTCR